MKIMIQNARIGFAHGIFKASALEDNQQPKYGADFIIEDGRTKVFIVNPDKTRKLASMKDIMLAVADEAKKGKGQAFLEDLEASKKCHRNGDRRTDKNGEVYDGYEGNWYVTAKSVARPSVFDRDKTPLTEADGKPYSGCYVNATMDIYANTVKQKQGVFAGLTGVQFAADGDAFGGGSPATAGDFDDLSDGADGDDLG